MIIKSKSLFSAFLTVVYCAGSVLIFEDQFKMSKCQNSKAEITQSPSPSSSSRLRRVAECPSLPFSESPKYQIIPKDPKIIIITLFYEIQ